MASNRNFAYKNSHNKAGELHVVFEPDVARLIKNYCKARNLNCKKYVNQAMLDQVQKDREARYASMTRDELLEELKALGGMA